MLKIDDIHEIEITGYGSDGEGVGRVDGIPVFVPFVANKEIVEVRITHARKTFARGELVRIIQASEDRRAPECEYFGVCGGCALSHISYDAQLEAKRERLLQCLMRIGKQTIGDIEVFGMYSSIRYRNKGVFPLGVLDGRAKFGMYSARSHALVALEDCLLQKPEVGRILRVLEGYISSRGVPVKNVLSAVVRSTAGGDFGVILNMKEAKLPDAYGLLAMLRAEVRGVAYLCITDENEEATAGEDYLTEDICGLSFRVSPSSFLQVNPYMTDILYQKILDFANISRTDKVLDAYCGIGTISLLMAKRALYVYGVESLLGAVEDARHNALANGIDNVEFICCEAHEAAALEGINVVVLDPPRKGLSPEMTEKLKTSGVDKIVYVSCDPATLARDVGILASAFKPKRVAMFDNFAQTAHLEAVVLMERI